MTPIPQEWIRDYVDKLVHMANQLSGSMRDATLLRADHAMDLVEAFRESRSKPQKRYDAT